METFNDEDFKAIRNKLLNYNPKNKERTAKFLSNYDNTTIFTAMIQIVIENSCEAFYICNVIHQIIDVLNQVITQELLISIISRNFCKEVGIFCQILLNNGVISESLLPSDFPFLKINHFEEFRLKPLCKTTEKALMTLAEKRTEQRCSAQQSPKRTAKFSGEEKQKGKIEIPSSKTFKLEGLQFEDNKDLKRKVVNCMTTKLNNEDLSQDDKYLLKLISTTLGLMDGRALDLVNNCIPLYSLASVRRFIASVKEELMNAVHNIEEVATIIKAVYPQLSIDNPIYATLAGDAAQVYDNLEAKNLYCFELLPLSKDLPVTPTHFKLIDKGSAPATLTEWYDKLTKKLEELNIRILFIATDGERAMNSKHNSFFL